MLRLYEKVSISLGRYFRACSGVFRPLLGGDFRQRSQAKAPPRYCVNYQTKSKEFHIFASQGKFSFCCNYLV